MNQFSYITDLKKEEILNKTVIRCINESHFQTILIKNSDLKKVSKIFSTENLIIKTNVLLEMDDIKVIFHIISCKRQDIDLLKNFDTIYEYLFKKIENPITGNELSELIDSFNQLFIQKADDITSAQIGLIGELLSLLFLYNEGIHNINEYYHVNNFNKHDIELTNKIKLEVKTTKLSNRIHRLKHDQLVNEHYNIFFISILLKSNENGFTLYDLCYKVIKLFDDYKFTFNIKKLMNYSGVNESEKGVSFSFEDTYESIRLFEAKDMPKIMGNIPDGITNLAYDVNCDYTTALKVSKLIDFLLNCKGDYNGE